jgi:hypothetical protein
MHVPRFPNHNRGEIRCDIGDEIEQWLNDRTPMVCLNCGETMCWEEDLYRAIHDHNRRMYCADGVMGKPQSYVWHWHDGEFFLSPTCEDPDDCEDLDCAHWD